MKDDDIALDELFAAARDLRPPAGAEARGWARFESALGGPGGPPPGEATPTTLGWLAPTAKLGAVAAAVLALGVVLAQPDAPPRRERATAGAPSTISPLAERAASEPAATPESPLAERAASEPAATPESPLARAPSPSSIPAPTSMRPAAASRTSAPRPTTRAEPVADAAPEVVVVQRPTTTSPTTPTAAPSAAPADSLRVEAELLGRAWVAIREGRAAATRALLAEHARRFPEGALVPERRACELVARCIAGERGAIEDARGYLDRHRASHLADRVAAGCGLEAPTSP